MGSLAKSLLVPIVLIAAFAVANPVRAAELEWQGTLSIDIGDFPGGISWTGTGVATVNGSAGGAALETLRLGALPFPASFPSGTGPGVGSRHFSVETLPQFGIASYGYARAIIFTPDAGFAGGTLTGFSGGGSLGGIPVGNISIFGGNAVSRFNLTQNDGATGFGVGGSFVTTHVYCAGNCDWTYPPVPVWWNAVWVSVAGAPWTLGTVTVVNPTTGTAGSATGMATGFMHGPLSNTTTVAQTGGLLQIVTPMSVQLGRSNGLDYRDEGSIGYIGKLTLRFIPEPGQLLLLGTGVLALVVMGWRRHRP